MKKFAVFSMLLGGLTAALIFCLSIPPTGAQGGQLAPDGKPRETYYAPFPLPITLDGDLADWEGVPRVVVPASYDPASGKPGVSFAGAADEQFLYFMADIYDDNIISGQHEADYWNEDSVEFYINATGDLTRRDYVDGVAQVTIPALNMDLPPEQHIIAGVQGDTVDATVQVVKTDTGWAVELALPLQNDVWSITPQHGGALGFQVHLNGASTSNRDTKLIWSVFDTADQSYLNPSLFGYLIFYEIGQTDTPGLAVATPTPIPTQAPIDYNDDFRKPWLPVEERVEDLLARMTLEEKIGQMTQVEKNSIQTVDIITYAVGSVLSGGGGYPDPNTPEAWAEMVDGFQDAALRTPLGIPLIYGVDAVHGHNNMREAVIFPHQIGLGAADDPDLMTRIGQATANEMLATGVYWNFAPVVAVPQDIRWGRTYEAYGQDTELVSRLGVAYLEGLQGDNLAGPLVVIGTPKHFLGDGAAVWGTSTAPNYMIDQGVMQVDEETVRALYLPPYQAAIEAGARSIMVSFSSWNDTKMHAQQYLITDVLKSELGFTGFVVSDWAGIDQIAPDDYYTSVVTAINAGIDMSMVPYDYKQFIDTMLQAVENGDITEARIDDAVRRILRVKFELGLFEHPFSQPELLSTVGSASHRALGREAVGKSLVLLKNDGDLLPLDVQTPLIFVAGEAANDIGIQSGGWTIEWQGMVGDITPGTTILEAVQQTAGSGSAVVYDATGKFADQTTASGDPLKADIGIVVVGERPYAEGVGDDGDLALPNKDLKMLEVMRDRCEKLVVILVSGRPLIVTDLIDGWDAAVAAWLPGTEGQGVVDGLFGLRAITGKLSFEWPRSVDQLPLGSGSGEPLFPLGYGLETTVTPPDDLAALFPEVTALDDFEGEIISFVDPHDNDLGFAPWIGKGGEVTFGAITVAPGDELALPDQVESTTVFGVTNAGESAGGYAHRLTDGVKWIVEDWSSYSEFGFWLYGANSGEAVEILLLNNRPGRALLDAVERWSYTIADDFSGWRFFSIPFSDFVRLRVGQPKRAPDDGLNLDQMMGYAFAFPPGTYYMEQVSLLGEPTSPHLPPVPPVPRPEVALPPQPDPDSYNFSGRWEMVWSDEFEAEAGTPIGETFWTCETGGHGWGNEEWEYYTDRIENVAHDGEGHLVITAIEETLPGSECWYGECQYTSARCVTQDKFEFTYGKIEARIKVPFGQGIWPAFWMLGANFPEIEWPNDGELDIMEYVGKEPQKTYGTLHGPGYSGAQGIGATRDYDTDVAADYHIFSIEWEPLSIRWYVDGELYHVVTPATLEGKSWVFDHDFFMLLNLAVGGQWPGYPDETTVFPQQFIIDWIRLYQRQPA